MMADDSVSIWDDYKRTGDKRLRDRLILTYAPLVKYVAGRLGTGLPAHVDEGDLVSYGLLGLMNAKLGYSPKRWGLHNYLEANRFKMTRLRLILKAMNGADVWLTETGGLVRRNNGSTTDIPEGATHAAEVTRFLFDRVLPQNPRIKAVYLYHWNAGPLDTTWDSGLITPAGRERTALFVLRRVLTSGQRPTASFRSPRR